MHKTLLMVSTAFAAVFSLFGMRLPDIADEATAWMAQRQELLFSHALHVEENGMVCDECHSSATDSETGADNLLPEMEICESCHTVDDPETCGTCHVDGDNPDSAPRIEDYSQKFSHALHAANDLECEACHADVAMSGPGEPVMLPGMNTCMTCHEERGASQECMTCHLAGEKLTPASHDVDFRHRHADLAMAGGIDVSGLSCQTCHDDDFCQDCHESENVDRLTHPLNFAFTHALEAQANKQTCVACHTDQQFCIDCHQDNQVLPHTHTAGWTNTVDGGRHRLEALNDIASCMACHEDNADRICQPCHGDRN